MKAAMSKRPGNELPAAMSYLEIGNQLFHNGMPVELLYRIGHDKCQETWRVRPLFVRAPNRDEQFRQSDVISFLHTMRASGCRCAA
jgi:hypothetical protein